MSKARKRSLSVSRVFFGHDRAAQGVTLKPLIEEVVMSDFYPAETPFGDTVAIALAELALVYHWHILALAPMVQKELQICVGAAVNESVIPTHRLYW